jgi:hypothetical protein
MENENPWISVKDSLPANFDYVLVYAQMSGTDEPCPMSIARYEADKWEILFEKCSNEAACACGDLTWHIDAGDITHWKPLPKPPKG